MSKLTRMLTCCSIVAAALLGCEKTRGHESSRDVGGNTGPAAQPAAACPTATSADCVAAQQKTAELQAQRDDAASKNDSKTVARIALQLNKEAELLALFQAGTPSPEALQGLDSKYEQLNKLLETELTKAPEQTNPNNTGTPGSGSGAGPEGAGPEDAGPEGAGVPVNPLLPSVVYHPLEIKAIAEIAADFGDLYINETPKAADGKDGWEELKVDMPWAGFWYPIRGNELYDGETAPLAKLDKAVDNAGRKGHAVDEAKKATMASGAESWEGLCAPWALASISTTEPKATVTVDGVDFTVNDQKALLTKIHEKATSKIYGIRYEGNDITDGSIQDIRPEAFHRIFMKRLGDDKQPFAIDSDAGPEVWAKPVYRVRWNVKKDPEKDNAYIVRALPWMVIHRSEIKDSLTSSTDRYAPTYDYRLYVDPATQRDGKLKVIAGEWLNESHRYHPDYIVVPVKDGKLGSNNAGINEALDVVRQIVGLH